MSFDVRTRLHKLKNSAKNRGINVNLDINKYQHLIDMGCHFCGSDLSKENGYCLDRVDSKKGYTLMNVVPCCKICNRAKSDMDVQDFISWVQKAAKHIEKQIALIRKFESMGITEEVYLKLSEEQMRVTTKQFPKERLKMVNSIT